MTNLILNVDSYKSSHYLQYPPGLTRINSYIESRGIAEDCPIKTANPEIVNFGLQAFIKEYLLKPITLEDVNEAEEILTAHGEPFNHSGWLEIVNKYGGYLPLEIESLPEGLPVPVGTTQVQLRNTDDNFAWLTSYIETSLLRSVWYPSTVATVSREVKKVIYKYLKSTSDDPDNQIMFKLHDFGARGVSSNESAMLGGMAHLINFMGTDTIGALIGAKRYYNDSMAGFSIPAAEHSTMTSWGEDNEISAYKNMLNQFAKPGKLVAIVSDSYDIYNAAENIWGTELKEQVINSGATVVIRPDSGNPIVCVMSLLKILGDRFGYTENTKRFKVLHPSIRIIQGDGVNYDTIKEILKEMWIQGWSADNITFGMGGALLQKVNRDTFKYAMKANAKFVEGSKVWSDVYKSPITDPGKESKCGVLSVVKNGKYQTFRRVNLLRETDLLGVVYQNGSLIKDYTFKEVRDNAKL